MSKSINIKNIGKALSLKSIGRFFASFFNERFQLLAFIVVFFSLAFLVFLWYSYIFKSEWSELEIKSYTQNKQSKSEIIFNRENFEKVIEESKNRSAEFERTLNDMQDIFRLKN
jgi:hypothetical protein